MIDYLEGILRRKSLTGVVIDIGGVGLAVSVPVGTTEKIGGVGDKVRLVTYLHVREDALDLYGFDSIEERDLFKDLLKVSGIGPKLALAILSSFRCAGSAAGSRRRGHQTAHHRIRYRQEDGRASHDRTQGSIENISRRRPRWGYRDINRCRSRPGA